MVKPLLLVASLSGLIALGLAARAVRGERAEVVQPIAFDHALHAEQDLGCIDCHATADRAARASFPKLATCLLCHSEPQGEHPDEPKLREFAERGAEIPWVQVNTSVGHVYFSHAMHVKLGAMECAECHGDMSAQREPVTRSQVAHLSMARCMDCHAERGASNDCLACHK